MVENKNKKQTTYIVVAVLFLLILIIGAAYSYFQIIANNNTSTTTLTSNSELVGQATLTTNEEGKILKLDITAEMMHSSNANTTYYATPSGTPVTSAEEGNGIYTLATASITESDVTLDCTYTYDISLSSNLTKEITDGSDEDFKVVIIESNGTETPYTLAQIKSGVTHTGKIKKLAYGTDQKIKIKAYVTNTESNQNDLSGISISIKIQPRSGELGFSCDTTVPTAAEKLIASGELWQSGLEGDGYRYAGTGASCSYDNGNYTLMASPDCPTLYNYTRTTISDGSTTNYTYRTSCPSDTSTYTYSCTELAGVLVDRSNVPNNFICFGTNDKTECKNNEAKYMYRIIGVFPDSSGTQHVKLISFKQLGSYKWNDTNADVDWGSSTLFTSLNGSYFLTNTTYDYLQNNTWLNKIEDWTWSAVNTKTWSNSGPGYHSITTQEMYLHEMNRSSKTSSIGEWSTPVAKIGLMYASDYQMSLGSSSLSDTGSPNSSTLKTGWMHQSNNYTTSSSIEWTIARYGRNSSNTYYALHVSSSGYVSDYNALYGCSVRPVLYLGAKETIVSGSGEYNDPYILR